MSTALLPREYQLLRGQSIGEGGTSSVVLVNRAGLNRTTPSLVAKLIDARQPHSFLAYSNECMMLDQLQDSPNIIRKVDEGLLANREEAAILLELMDYDLLTLMLDFELSEREKWEAFYQICLAVQSCHQKNIAHLERASYSYQSLRA